MLEWHKVQVALARRKYFSKRLLKHTNIQVEEETKLNSDLTSNLSQFLLLPLELWPLESDEEH